MDTILIAIPLTKVVGVVAGIFTGTSLLPQVIKMYREKKGSQVSTYMIVILIAGLSLWIWYGFLKEDWPIIVTNVFSLLLNIVMVIMKFVYRK